MKARMKALSVLVPIQTPEEVGQHFHEDKARNLAVIKAANIKLDYGAIAAALALPVVPMAAPASAQKLGGTTIARNGSRAEYRSPLMPYPVEDLHLLFLRQRDWRI